MRESTPDYPNRRYERPNQAWVCGLACDGHACPTGPSARGVCPVLSECMPVRDGDRWRCNRSALRGGECPDGPTPEGACSCIHQCNPVRSLRAVRGRFVTACTVLAAGALLILLSANWRNEAISPGPLARQHAQLLENGATAPNCSACHAAASNGVGGWTLTLAGIHGDSPTMSDRCMECHKSSITEKHALDPHSLPPELLQRLTVSHSDHRVPKAIACATCHREHHGADFNLTAMNDTACQSCHQQQFKSFSTDHPDFGRWPYERRTPIVFNHASHGTKHFAEKKQPFDCRSCHLDDANGNSQLLVPYDKACASCHDEKIRTSVAKGVPIFLLPTLDVDALQAAGHEIGPWPDDATGDFDGRLPPPMKLLLAGDPSASEAMKMLGADFDFFDVDPEDPDQLAACATLVAAMKRLMIELSESDTMAVQTRLSRALGHNVSATDAELLLAGLPQEMLTQTVKDWGIETSESPPREETVEISNSAMSEATEMQDSQTPWSGGALLEFDPAGSWEYDASTLSIRYQPQAHADPVLASWLHLIASTPSLTRHQLPLAIFTELANPTAPGLCASCHSAEHAPDGRLLVNWHAAEPVDDRRLLTKFTHGPHLLLPQLADCTGCHATNSAAVSVTAYAGYDPRSFVSDFQPMSKNHCATCHTAKAAGESCTQCHNYHVNDIESWRIDTVGQ